MMHAVCDSAKQLPSGTIGRGEPQRLSVFSGCSDEDALSVRSSSTRIPRLGPRDIQEVERPLPPLEETTSSPVQYEPFHWTAKDDDPNSDGEVKHTMFSKAFEQYVAELRAQGKTRPRSATRYH